MMTCHLPLNEILVDFNDRLKSVTHGYGSMDYDMSDYVESSLVRMEILVNAEPVDAFSTIVHSDKAESRGRGALRQAQGHSSASTVQDCVAGCRGRQSYCPGDHKRHEKGRDGQVLRRRHKQKKKIA